MKGWVAFLPIDGGVGKAAFGEHFNEVTIEVRAKYKNYLHAIVEKLADNVLLSSITISLSALRMPFLLTGLAISLV